MGSRTIGRPRLGVGWALVIACALVHGACSVAIVHDLDEGEANGILTSLQARGIAADKLRAVEGNKATYAVRVPGGEATRAWRVLREENLPRPRRAGMGEVFGKPGLIPTATQERALYQHALSEEIARTLQAVEGVLEARVHLVLPTRDPLTPADAPPPTPRASVLLRHASPTPLAREEVQRLVAGAIDGLRPEGVSVVLVAAAPARPTATAGAAGPAVALVPLGPFAVAEGSHNALRATLVGAALLLLLLAVALILVVRRQRALLVRLRAAEAGQVVLPDDSRLEPAPPRRSPEAESSLGLVSRSLSRGPRPFTTDVPRPGATAAGRETP